MYISFSEYPVVWWSAVSPSRPYSRLRMTVSGMSVIRETAVEMWMPIAAGVTILSTASSSALRMMRMTISRRSLGSSWGTPSEMGWTK